MNETKLYKILDDMVEQFGNFEDYDRCVRFKEDGWEFYMESLNKENMRADVRDWRHKIALHILKRIEESSENGNIDFESCLKYKTKKWWKVSFENHLTKTYINVVDRGYNI